MALKTKQVGRYTISQIGPLQEANLRIFQRRVDELIAKGDNPAYAEALRGWPFVAACVTPYISEDEYIDTPLTELRLLSDTAEEVNEDLTQEAPKKKPSKAPR